MNRYFDDSAYHLKRAAETARVGLREEVRSVERRLRGLLGRDPDPEPTRVERLRTELTARRDRMARAARETVAAVRRRLAAYRERGPA